jgi:hypothetical protein
LPPLECCFGTRPIQAEKLRPDRNARGSAMLTKIENAVKVEPAGEFELKGIRRPLAAYNLVGAVS